MLNIGGTVTMVANIVYKMDAHLHLRYVIQSKSLDIKYGSRRIHRDKRRSVVSNLGNDLLTQVLGKAVRHFHKTQCGVLN